MLHVITRHVSGSIAKCELTCIDRAPIDVGRMVEQHEAYVDVFKRAAKLMSATDDTLQLVELPALSEFADSMFVEDVALMLESCAILTRPGAASRQGEVNEMAPVLVQLMDTLQRPLYRIEEPGTVDGGDVLIIGRDVFVGRSTRTNDEGFAQLKSFVAKHGYNAHQVFVKGCLHLKCVASLVTPKTVLINPKGIERTTFTALGYGVLDTAPEEPDSANVLSFALRCSKNGITEVIRTIVVPSAFPRLAEKLEKYCQAMTAAAGEGEERLRVEVINVDEVAKAEGALTCCSLLCYA
ncbi:amidinotransferase-like protein, putative [Bodo saltans]|uniref:Amidinotransferase-like protein, putative n=1 Tax=Bodo saltans TaxID=75058 RepID=A0A0S4J9U5_BODSA|nr:amidinotransferase-like protein, putative [Bodo saltans]|eukprot:CUG86701.1 amidinotransferase-like protein, putative [Bodo saltans]